MQKKKVKEKRLRHRLTLWLSVLFLGLLVGVSIQFTRAWVEPSTEVTAPDGNIAAPINTGASEQTKVGAADKKADICVDAFGNGDKRCLSDLVSFPTCTLSGGVPTTVGAVTVCKFAGAECPDNTSVNGTTVNWIQYLNYSETSANNCTGAGSCGSNVTSGSHVFGNIDYTTERVSYLEGNSEPYTCCPGGNNCSTGQCWNGVWWVDCGWECCSWTTCTDPCTTITKYCDSTRTAVGCVIN